MVYWINCSTYKWWMLKSNAVMYFLVHSLWSITSAKPSGISIQLNKHVTVLQKERKVLCPYSVCVCVCVVGARSNSVIVPRGGMVSVPVWPFSHANQPVFSGACCLNYGLHGVCVMRMYVNLCSSVCVCACSILWDSTHISTQFVHWLHIAVCCGCSSVGLQGSCVSIPVDVKQINSTSLLGS